MSVVLRRSAAPWPSARLLYAAALGGMARSIKKEEENGARDVNEHVKRSSLQNARVH